MPKRRDILPAVFILMLLAYILPGCSNEVDEARDFVLSIVQEAEVGKTYTGTVKKTTDFGAFVEILPGKEGLVHISKLSRQRVKKVTDVVKVGDRITVKVVKIDEQGRINLVRKE